MTSATDELRRMLDERGVEWDELPDFDGSKMTRWRDSMGRYVTAYDDGAAMFFVDFYWGPTPQQAVDATLGRGTCVNMDEETDAEWFTCSECNTELRVHEPFDSFSINYCPNCGRRVVEQ